MRVVAAHQHVLRPDQITYHPQVITAERHGVVIEVL
jgi:hypothetical protein